VFKGADLIADLRAWLPGWEPEMVFDVGANIGQSTAEYLAAFRQARIHCFEPISSTFAELSARFAGSSRVVCTQCALGASEGEGTMIVHAGSTMSSLTDAAPEGVPTERVPISSLDEVCRARAIERIDLLKVDTEGHDLEVLRGAAELLAGQAIAVVAVEAGMNPENDVHVPFESLKAHLEAADYRLFGIYEQKEEWPTMEPHLRRTNPAFIARSTIERFRGRGSATG
jgi:FkbM family methyltransferase